MSLYVGEDKNKSWEDLLDSLSRYKDTWEDAELIAFCVTFSRFTEDKTTYIKWLAKCALHLQAKLNELSGEKK